MPTTRTLSATFIEPGPDAGDRLRIKATTESGFDLGFDTLSASEGGIGPGPTEAILASLAACTAMDVASILRKKRQRVESYQIQATAYCPVSAMLSGSVPIDHRYRLQRDGADEEMGLAAHTGPPAG